jgi:hypothetical protein
MIATTEAPGTDSVGIEGPGRGARPPPSAFLVYRVNNSTKEEEKHNAQLLGG